MTPTARRDADIEARWTMVTLLGAASLPVLILLAWVYAALVGP